ncbi:MAG: AAA family ATPase [Acidimicrobiia bacterium]
MGVIVATAATKGGCGKTTTAVALAQAAAAEGVEVRILDLDPQGSAATCAPDLVDKLPAASPAEIRSASQGWELVILDLPPGAQPGALAGLETADLVVAVTGLNQLELDGLAHLTRMIDVDLLIPTRLDRRKKLHGEALGVLRRQFGDRLAEPVPLSAAVEHAQAAGEPMPVLSPPAIAYRACWDRLRPMVAACQLVAV